MVVRQGQWPPIATMGFSAFVEGAYAWANREAFMLAYVRDGSSIDASTEATVGAGDDREILLHVSRGRTSRSRRLRESGFGAYAARSRLRLQLPDAAKQSRADICLAPLAIVHRRLRTDCLPRSSYAPPRLVGTLWEP